MEQKNKTVIIPVELLSGNINEEATSIYIGKDSENNLYHSQSIIDVVDNNWKPLSDDKYQQLKNDLHSQQLTDKLYVSNNSQPSLEPDQDKNITMFETLQVEFEGELNVFEIGKDKEDNLYRSAVHPIDWRPLSNEKYQELKSMHVPMTYKGMRDGEIVDVEFDFNKSNQPSSDTNNTPFEKDHDFADAMFEHKDQNSVDPMFDSSNTAESVDKFVKDLENDTPTYEDQTVEKALNMSLDKEDIQQILELEKLRSENKELTHNQKLKILNNPNFSDEKKLVLLTFMNDKNPEKTMTEHYTSLSAKANKDVEMKTGRELHSSKDNSNSAKKNASKIANAIEKTSRFTVD